MTLPFRAAVIGLLALVLAACASTAPTTTPVATTPAAPVVVLQPTALEKAEATFTKACEYSRLATTGWGFARLFVKLSDKDLATADWAVDQVFDICTNPPELRTVSGWTAAVARLNAALRDFKAARAATKEV